MFVHLIVDTGQVDKSLCKVNSILFLWLNIHYLLHEFYCFCMIALLFVKNCAIVKSVTDYLSSSWLNKILALSFQVPMCLNVVYDFKTALNDRLCICLVSGHADH